MPLLRAQIDGWRGVVRLECRASMPERAAVGSVIQRNVSGWQTDEKALLVAHGPWPYFVRTCVSEGHVTRNCLCPFSPSTKGCQWLAGAADAGSSSGNCPPTVSWTGPIDQPDGQL